MNDEAPLSGRLDHITSPGTVPARPTGLQVATLYLAVQLDALEGLMSRDERRMFLEIAREIVEQRLARIVVAELLEQRRAAA